MRWRSGCTLRGRMPPPVIYELESTHALVHNLFLSWYPSTPTSSPPLASSQPSPTPSPSQCKGKRQPKSHDLPQIISPPAPPRRNIHVRSLLPRWLTRPNNPNPPHHIPLGFTRPAQHNHHIISLDPAPSWGELMRYCACGCWEGVRWWG